MKIHDIRVAGLSGGTVEGRWADELKPEDDVHTIVEVVAEDGFVGVGSVFTSKALVAGAVKLLRPSLIAERADEPMRVPVTPNSVQQPASFLGRGTGP